MIATTIDPLPVAGRSQRNAPSADIVRFQDSPSVAFTNNWNGARPPATDRLTQRVSLGVAFAEVGPGATVTVAESGGTRATSTTVCQTAPHPSAVPMAIERFPSRA